VSWSRALLTGCGTDTYPLDLDWPISWFRPYPSSPPSAKHRIGRATIAAAVLHLTALRGGAFTGLDSIPAARPVCRARRERASGLDHRLAGRQDPGPPGIWHCGACPALGPISSSVPPARTGRCRQRHGGRGCPVTSEGHGHSGVLGRHGGVSEGRGGRRNRVCMTSLKAAGTLGGETGSPTSPSCLHKPG
jgi:hypothetical protein